MAVEVGVGWGWGWGLITVCHQEPTASQLHPQLGEPGLTQPINRCLILSWHGTGWVKGPPLWRTGLRLFFTALQPAFLLVPTAIVVVSR